MQRKLSKYHDLMCIVVRDAANAAQHGRCRQSVRSRWLAVRALAHMRALVVSHAAQSIRPSAPCA